MTRTMTPKGKGMYIWLLNRTGSPEQAAAAAKEAGFDWLAIKCQNGTLSSDGNSSEDEFRRSADVYLAAFRKVGIDIWGWGYIYGGSITKQEVEATKRAVKNFSLSGWIIDAEHEYKTHPGRKESAVYYCNELRYTFPSLPIGLSSYRFPSLHMEFPWREFLDRMDFHAPQVYWLQASNAGEQLRRSHKELNSLRTLPFVPAGCSFPHGKWSPTVDQMDDFYRVVLDLNCPAWFWWEWYYAAKNPDWWRAIAKHGKPQILSIEERVALLEKDVSELKKHIGASLGQPGS